MTPKRIKAIREKMGVNQATFAARLRVSHQTVQTWEQGTRKPGGPAVCILEMLERETKA